MKKCFEGKNAIIIMYKSFGIEDVITFMESLGITVSRFEHEHIFDLNNDMLENDFFKFTSTKSFDFVFSFNYYPAVSYCCNKLCQQGYDIRYISVVYDNPHIPLYTYTLAYPCNCVFTFDYSQYEEFYNGGIKTIYYAPLPVNVNRLNNTLGILTENTTINYNHDISFVGTLYNQSYNYYDELVKRLKEEQKDTLAEYLDKVIDVQSRTYGNYILEEYLTEAIVSEIYSVYPYEPNKHSIATKKYVYANYFLGRKVAETERLRILNLLSQDFNVSLYTDQASPQLPDVKNLGPADYYSQMPKVFRESKINLNISLKTIKTGIPLRAMDIMGCGGFLLTNYQQDFLRHFIPDEDFVYYSSDEDLHAKAEYYLVHENERKDIAYNGYRKISADYTYENILTQILAIGLGIDDI